MGNIVPAGPTARRVRELLACGVTVDEIATAAGRPPGVVSLLTGLQLISRSTAEAIERADLELLGPMPDPDEPDPVVVERMLAGAYRGPYTRAERREAVRQAHALGMGDRQVSERLGLHKRQVQRDLDALGLTTHRKAAA